MNPYPGDFGDFVIGCGPALVMTIIVLAAIWVAIKLIELAIWIRRGLRLLDELTDRGDGQGGIPPTRAMDLGGLAIPAHDGHITDRTATEQWAAVQDALTPRMVAPTRAQLASTRQRCTRCRTGKPQLPCMCGYDCYAAHCLAETPGGNR